MFVSRMRYYRILRFSLMLFVSLEITPVRIGLMDERQKRRDIHNNITSILKDTWWALHSILFRITLFHTIIFQDSFYINHIMDRFIEIYIKIWICLFLSNFSFSSCSMWFIQVEAWIEDTSWSIKSRSQ